MGGIVRPAGGLYSIAVFHLGTVPMTIEQRKTEYLAKAKEAEQQAAKAALVDLNNS